MVIHMAARINEQQFEEKVLKADKPVLVDFYSDTCIPCKRMAGVLGEIEDDYDGKLDVFKINVNYEQIRSNVCTDTDLLHPWRAAVETDRSGKA